MISLVNNIDLVQSSGIQNLQARIIKDAMLAIPNVICDLINNSFKLGIFPKAWKQATVVPIHKGGNKGDMGNYCPILLLYYWQTAREINVQPHHETSG